MKKKRILRWFGVLLLLLLLSAAGIVLFWEKLPYQSAAETQIRRALSERGFNVTSLLVEKLSGEEAILTDIRLGKDPSLYASRMSAEYQFSEIRHGKLRSLTVDQPQIHLYQKDDGWRVGGLESLPVSESPGGVLDGDSIRALLPEKLGLTKGILNITAKNWAVVAPFDASADNAGAMTLTIPKLEATGLPRPVPPLAIKGKGKLEKDAMLWTFTVTGPDGAGGTGNVRLPFANPASGSAWIARAQYPWGGGWLRATKFDLPLAMNKPVDLTLEFENVDIASLLNDASGGKVQATGRVSGKLPVIYYPDGRIELNEGTADGLEKGTITVAPELIPGENQAQIETLRAALKNFQYTSLKIRVSQTADQKSTIHLALEGSNPNALEGRQVRLNVNLKGDILPLIQQSLLPIQDIRTLLKTKE
ncbi:MAG: YdbH domain-containing protein [Alphaproteobacteria bacterium]|nr:YdbH domain-containing protein [Alphaproteobacteria bacterium]